MEDLLVRTFEVLSLEIVPPDWEECTFEEAENQYNAGKLIKSLVSNKEFSKSTMELHLSPEEYKGKWVYRKSGYEASSKATAEVTAPTPVWEECLFEEAENYFKTGIPIKSAVTNKMYSKDGEDLSFLIPSEIRGKWLYLRP
ncbi:hypothetical protein [Gordoniibacillus kamchatkensis]|uniref:hypothetical protein n=1 Tax=Gordoniibacillus kamchatkensis TaxID=1590651 RepID=UPI001E3A7CAF|nr:hypothetical protein [Paenibacillus sp. VKM B-2647]